MTNHDSFIDEVTEEVRRDRLFRLFRRYGWIAVLAVVLIVAGAAVNEWRKSQARQAAQAEGDAVLAALDRETPAARAQALEGIDASGDVAAVLALLAAAETAQGDGRAAALDRLDRVAAQDGLDAELRDLAALKSVILRGTALPPQERIARLEPLDRARRTLSDAGARTDRAGAARVGRPGGGDRHPHRSSVGQRRAAGLAGPGAAVDCGARRLARGVLRAGRRGPR